MIERSKIIEILQYWNFWNRKIYTGIPRPTYTNELFRQRKLKEISILTGIRHSGKSTIILQVFEEIIKSGVNPLNTLYINFEEPAFAANLVLDFLSEIYDAYLEQFNPKGKVYIVLDEIQYISSWEKFVRSIYDRNENVKFYITGSSSKLLSKEYGTSLTGRIYTNEIFPLDFREFLQFKNFGGNLSKVIGTGTPDIRNLFLEYMKYGGFPRVVLVEDDFDKSALLKEYYSSIIEKDIAQRHSIKDIRKLKEFCLDVITNISTTYSGYKSVKNIDISQPTANSFIQFLEEAYLINKIDYFSYSFSKMKANPFKAYSIDTGLYNSVSFKFSENIGRVFENLIFLVLRRNKKEIFYWKDDKGKEVDFLIKEGNKIIEAINVCWNLDENNKKREVSGLISAMQEFNLNEAAIVTWDHSSKLNVGDKMIFIKNIFEFIK